MRDRLMTSIVLYGSIEDQDMGIWKWYRYFLNLFKELGCDSTHIGIISNSFKSGKLTTINRTEARLKKACENGENIETISLYALPHEFTQAAFEYHSFTCMNKSLNNQFIMVTVPSEDYSRINRVNLINDLGIFIICTECEVFELSVLESPLIYASRVNQVSDFRGLKIIDKFELDYNNN